MKNISKSQIPELLAPAGSLYKLELAYRHGADACYIGVASFSMRTRENKVKENELTEAKNIADRYGKKLFVCVNNFPRNFAISAIRNHLLFLKKLKPDALIIADPGIILMCKNLRIKIPIHLSVQNSTANFEAVKFWQKTGIERIILARELSISEIAEIKKEVPKMELESFIHGSICMAYSGRCFLSNYFRQRNANCGMCAHSCREKYRVTNYEDSKADIHSFEKQAMLQETGHPDREMIIEEDAQGSYLMSSRDMCLLPHLKELQDAGVECFKVEGRNKSEYYLAVVIRTYRKALDDLAKGKKFDKKLVKEINKTKNRGFFTGFFFPKKINESEEYTDHLSSDGQQYFMGKILKVDKKNHLIKIEVKNKITPKMKLRMLSEKYGKEKVLTVKNVGKLKNEEDNIKNSKPRKSVSGGVYAVLEIKENLDKKWEGLLLQAISN